ncbi:L,D-transpeptidase [Polaribacter staleyi]|uniref:L,D-transpeptidase n=1 Tax=Polaribacter staleyi TaxID=2022337 RepID=UPI0031BBAD07
MKNKVKYYIVLVVLIFFNISNSNAITFLQVTPILKRTFIPKKVKVKKNITVENYFQFIDSVVVKYDSLTNYKLTEHLLVRANPYIIDVLKNTDYYLMIKKDSFVYDQKKMIVLKKGDQLIVPNSKLAKKLSDSFKSTRIDVNIPEFKLRILENSKELYSFPIRVGRNEKKYLKMAGRILDLKTKTGEGKIVGYERFPDFYNPANGHRYYLTNRDDKKVTKLPQVPFIETEINGIRYGQLIHTTTNPKTLEKAYSNGCIGTKESDIWVIYYYAPVNTKITIRYHLNIKDSISGKTTVLKDIYGYQKK